MSFTFLRFANLWSTYFFALKYVTHHFLIGYKCILIIILNGQIYQKHVSFWYFGRLLVNYTWFIHKMINMH